MYRLLANAIHEAKTRYRMVAGPPKVALASFPRSGNTWVRRLVENATGKKTGSVYDDRVMPRGPEGIVIKTHRLDSRRYTSGIHLVRDPFDAIESWFALHQRWNGTSEVSWDEFVLKKSQDWKQHTAHWVEAPRPMKRLRFEDLKADTAEALSEILMWLDEPHTSADVSNAVEQASLQQARKEEGSDYSDVFYRKGEVGSGEAKYSEDQRSKIRVELSTYLNMLGY